MKMVEWRFLRGPNLFARRKVLYAVVDLEQLDEVPSSAVDGFTDRLLQMLPGIGAHHCGVGYEGGFVDRLREGTYMGHIAEHLMLELQSLAGDDIRYGNTRMIHRRPRHYRIVAGYEVEAVALRALQQAIEVVETAAAGRTRETAPFVAELQALRASHALSPATTAVATAARERGIPVLRLDDAGDTIQLGWGRRGRRPVGPLAPGEPAQAVVSRCMPAGEDGRIPLVAITATERAAWSSAARAVAAVLQAQGEHPGIADDGMGDEEAFTAAHRVLADPAVGAAVMCASPRTLLERGLAFDRSDVAVVLGLEPVPILPGAVDPLEEPARVAGILADTARRLVVLNADDPGCEAVLDEVREGVETLWISARAPGPLLRGHLAAGGRAVVWQGGEVVLLEGRQGDGRDDVRRTVVGPRSTTPASSPEGEDSPAVHAVLAAVAAGVGLDIPLAAIAEAMRTLDGEASVDPSPGPLATRRPTMAARRAAP